MQLNWYTMNWYSMKYYTYTVLLATALPPLELVLVEQLTQLPALKHIVMNRWNEKYNL